MLTYLEYLRILLFCARRLQSKSMSSPFLFIHYKINLNSTYIAILHWAPWVCSIIYNTFINRCRYRIQRDRKSGCLLLSGARLQCVKATVVCEPIDKGLATRYGRRITYIHMTTVDETFPHGTQQHTFSILCTAAHVPRLTQIRFIRHTF